MKNAQAAEVARLEDRDPDSVDDTPQRRASYGLAALGATLWCAGVAAMVFVVHDGAVADPATAHADHLHGSGGGQSFAAVLTAWGLMTIVMMAPTAIPVLRSFHDLARSVGHWWTFLSAYLTVWLVVAALCASLQYSLVRAGWLGDDGTVAAGCATAAVLAVAGLYQFSVWKYRCLTGCTRPMTFFLQYWRDGAAGAVRMGLRHGATCVGCCWALMALAFVGGVHSLAWMALATVLMIVEKLPSVGERTRVPLGVALGASAAVVIALELT